MMSHKRNHSSSSPQRCLSFPSPRTPTLSLSSAVSVGGGIHHWRHLRSFSADSDRARARGGPTPQEVLFDANRPPRETPPLHINGPTRWEDRSGRPTRYSLSTYLLRSTLTTRLPSSLSSTTSFGALCIRDRCPIFIAGMDFLRGSGRNFRGFMAWLGTSIPSYEEPL